MTRVDVAATRCAVLRVVSFSIVALLTLALAACGGSSSTSTSLFGEKQTAASAAPTLPSVSLVQIIGAPPDVTGKLTDAVSNAAKDRQLSLVGEKEADYNIRGYLVAAPDVKGTKLSYIWDVSDRKGKRVRRIQNDEIIEGRKGGDPWSGVDDQALKKIAARTATELTDWLSKEGGSSGRSERVAQASSSGSASSSSVPAPRGARPAGAVQPVSASPAQVAPVTASMTPVASPAANAAMTYVPPVTGAPGDGQTALAEAMKRHLSRQGVKLVESRGAGAYIVTGAVQMGAVEGGEQPITIRWFVKDPSGKSLANAVVQRNKVPAGSLDGAWGQIADLAAGEAAKKIAELLPKPSS